MKYLIILITLIIIAGFVGCDYDDILLQEKEIEIGTIENYDFENDIDVKTFEDCFIWTSKNIQWESMKQMKSPEEIYKEYKKNGYAIANCEGQVGMTMYLLHKLGIYSYLVGVKVNATNTEHAILRIENKYYGADSPFDLNRYIDRNKYTVYEEYTYEQAMWLAVVNHDSDI